MHRPSPAILSRAFVLLLAAATFGVFAWTLGDLTIDRAADAGPANLDALRPFWAIGAGVWTMLTLVWWTHRSDDVGSRRRFLVAAATVLVVAGLARAWTIHAHAPALSDDVYRYVADARALAHGVNPYHPVPAERLR
ncbi:MAG: hypothetical protein KDA25_04155, partial [Phycisphaerales bacterium]|nr:hypothetical protein [Phycisphaerales bacterium]